MPRTTPGPKRAKDGKPAAAPRAPPKPAKPANPLKVPPLRVDPEKYPNLPANPGLERALRIRQALDQGRPREEAMAIADLALGPRGRHLPPAKSRKSGRPASGPRPGGEAQRPRRKPLAEKGRR